MRPESIFNHLKNLDTLIYSLLILECNYHLTSNVEQAFRKSSASLPVILIKLVFLSQKTNKTEQNKKLLTIFFLVNFTHTYNTDHSHDISS